MRGWTFSGFPKRTSRGTRGTDSAVMSLVLPRPGSVASMTLVERLGFAPDARLVILNADELGLTRASNVGVYDALRHGAATSASLMVPAPWARDAAAGYRGEDVGVHLTFNAEWDTYRW